MISCGQSSLLKEPSPEGNLVQILTSLTVPEKAQALQWPWGTSVLMLCSSTAHNEMGAKPVEHTHLLLMYFDVFSMVESQCPSAVGYHHVQNSPAP